MRRLLSLLLSSAFVLPLCAAPASAQSLSGALFSQLQWRNIGPFRAGRAITVTGVPGDPDTFYFGAVGGGVWETNNAGRTWQPIFDKEPVASIGAIAVAPSDRNVLYAGSGEADMRSDIQQGDGMYKSIDGGKTWSHIGLDDTRQIGRIAVDPKDPNVAYVAALGHQYGPSAQRGVFKTTDGGKTWSKVLYHDQNTGAIDLAIDPADANVVYASLWQTRRPPWNVYPPSNGPGSGLYKSTDGGQNLDAPDRPRTSRRRPGAYRHCGIAGKSVARLRNRRYEQRRHRRRAIAPTMAAQRGRAPTAKAASGSADGISDRSPPIRRTPMSCT